MLMLAMLVSTLVEMVHRLLGSRVGNLKKMVENLFVEIGEFFEPPPADSKGAANTTSGAGNTGDGTDGNSGSTKAQETKPAEAENGKPAEAEKAKPAEAEKAKPAKSFADNILMKKATANADRLDAVWAWSGLDRLPVAVFMQKLATEYNLKAELESKIDIVAADIAQKFEAFGQEMTEAFERRARLMSVIIAIAIAFPFNVDPLHIARTYLDEPERAAAVAEKADDLAKAFEAKQAEAAKKPEPAQTGDANANVAAGAQAAGDAAKDASARENELVAELQAFQAKIAAERLPLGWSATGADGKPLPACSIRDMKSGCIWTIAGIEGQWPPLAKLPLLLLGGLLVGLGAPYWAKVVSSVLALRDGSQKIAEIVVPATLAAGGSAQSVAVAAFKTALEAKEAKG
ncbi:MAG: hypothetical protein IPL47_11840 [Phyllobacteriaceae bacterium]|nr:hypothetical protein [Phyllobacteriaceae bacterium]